MLAIAPDAKIYSGSLIAGSWHNHIGQRTLQFASVLQGVVPIIRSHPTNTSDSSASFTIPAEPLSRSAYESPDRILQQSAIWLSFRAKLSSIKFTHKKTSFHDALRHDTKIYTLNIGSGKILPRHQRHQLLTTMSSRHSPKTYYKKTGILKMFTS